MRVVVAIFLSILLCAFSCEDSESLPIEGTYQGEFYRDAPGTDPVFSSVTLTLADGNFEGTSSIIKYPAICRGTYSIKNDEITFKDACYWTAEFDWTFILSGKFSLTENGELLIMKAERGNGVSDIYRMRRQRQ